MTIFFSTHEVHKEVNLDRYNWIYQIIWMKQRSAFSELCYFVWPIKLKYFQQFVYLRKNLWLYFDLERTIILCKPVTTLANIFWQTVFCTLFNTALNASDPMISLSFHSVVIDYYSGYFLRSSRFATVLWPRGEINCVVQIPNNHREGKIVLLGRE